MKDKKKLEKLHPFIESKYEKKETQGTADCVKTPLFTCLTVHKMV